MIGVQRFRRVGALAALAVATIVAAACQDQLPMGVGGEGAVPLRVTAPVVGTPIATLVVTVTASDIAVPLVFNLTVANGTASGTIRVPPGLSRTIAATAMDDQGNVTHDGSVTCDVRPGQNPPISLRLVPRSGQLPITITFGSYGVVVTPAAPSIGVGATVQLAAVVTDAYGHAVANPALAWATSQPTVATVSASGLVSGVAAGTASIVATYEGVAGPSSVTVRAGLVFASVSPAASHTCALTTGGAAYCWGDNQLGELGTGSTTGPQTCTIGQTGFPCSRTPAAVGGGLAFTTLTGDSYYFTCGLTQGGAAYCWGFNGDGELGDGTRTTRSSPVAVAGGLTFASLSAGAFHACGLTPAGVGYCWGDNSYGQLGDGTQTFRTSPVPVSGGATFASITAGGSHTCAVTTTGVTACWGLNSSGQLGWGSMTGPSTCVYVGSNYACGVAPVTVTGQIAFARLSAGASHTCGVTAAGIAYCWGENSSGQVGANYATDQAAPVAVTGGLSFGSLSAGGFHTCGLVLSLAGRAYCWGNNYLGQVGNGSTTTAPELTPSMVAGGLTFASVAAGLQHTCGVTAAGAAWCWGENTAGQLGDGTQANRTSPVAVVNP